MNPVLRKGIEMLRIEKNMVRNNRKGVGMLEITLGSEEVISRIRQLQSNGGTINKKQVKQHDPELMRSALHYFPSWEHAVKNAGLL